MFPTQPPILQLSSYAHGDRVHGRHDRGHDHDRGRGHDRDHGNDRDRDYRGNDRVTLMRKLIESNCRKNLTKKMRHNMHDTISKHD